GRREAAELSSRPALSAPNQCGKYDQQRTGDDHYHDELEERRDVRHLSGQKSRLSRAGRFPTQTLVQAADAQIVVAAHAKLIPDFLLSHVPVTDAVNVNTAVIAEVRFHRSLNSCTRLRMLAEHFPTTAEAEPEVLAHQ